MYEKLNEIYKREISAHLYHTFNLAIEYLLDIGFVKAFELTDEDINNLKGKGSRSQDFIQYIAKLSREIARSCNSSVEIIQFCQAENLF